jgi:hypothetical protein
VCAYHRVTGDAAPSVDVLIPLLKEEVVCYNAVSAVGQFGPSARDAVPNLVKMFNERRQHRKRNPVPVARALGRIGPGSQKAVPSLRRALRDDHWVSLTAALALWRIGERDEAVIAPVRMVLKQEGGSLLTETLTALDEHEDLAKRLLPEVRQLLVRFASSDSPTRVAALRILRRSDQRGP